MTPLQCLNASGTNTLLVDLTFPNAGSFNSITVAAGGTLAIGLAGTNALNAQGPQLTLNSPGTTTINSSIAGTNVTVAGGTVTLSGNNPYTLRISRSIRAR